MSHLGGILCMTVIFFLEMFRALALWHAEAHCPDVTPVGEKFLKRDLIRRLRNDLVSFGVVSEIAIL